MKKPFFALALLLAICSLTACSDRPRKAVQVTETPSANAPEIRGGRERMFVETEVQIPDAAYINKESRPIVYGLVLGREYLLKYSAKKYMNAVEGDMTIRIDVPQEFDVTGSTDWQGNDESYSGEIQLKPNQTGTFEITVEACNTEINFCTQNKSAIEVVASN